MPQVLTTKALVRCPHGFPGQSIPTDPSWSVAGGIVLLEGDTGTLPCAVIPPCGGYVLRSMGLNATFVGGRRVILATDFNQTLTGLPLEITEFHTTIDDSTPAPIPAGGAAPPLSPALADAIRPIVTAVPPALAFVTASPVAPLTTVFTILGDHPNLWNLTRVSEPAGTHADLTNGDPTGLTVVPAGGDWDEPGMIVTVTMTQTYIVGLGVGTHHFYLTGVSRRGLSGHFDVTLSVT